MIIEHTRAPAQALTHALIRELLLEIWGEQSCMHSANWPATLKQLFQKTEVRASYKGRVDFACDLIAASFADGTPDNPCHVMHTAFAMLDRPHREKLVERLIAAQRGDDA